jgi:hypothetical protein
MCVLAEGIDVFAGNAVGGEQEIGRVSTRISDACADPDGRGTDAAP